MWSSVLILYQVYLHSWEKNLAKPAPLALCGCILPLSPRQTILARLFRKRGYRTGCLSKKGKAHSREMFNPISLGVLGPGNTPGGAQSAHTQFKGSKLLFDLETLCVLSEIYIDFTRKKIGQNLKKSVIFWDLNFFWIWDCVTTWITKTAVTRSIFEIEGSYFGFFLIFMCLKNHI